MEGSRKVLFEYSLNIAAERSLNIPFERSWNVPQEHSENIALQRSQNPEIFLVLRTFRWNLPNIPMEPSEHSMGTFREGIVLWGMYGRRNSSGLRRKA